MPTPTANPTCRITIAFDNVAYDDQLTTSWGYAAMVECPGGNVLFDTGGMGSILVENLQRLGFDPASIQHVVLSHAHQDHYGGLDALARAGAPASVYVFPAIQRALAGPFPGMEFVNVEAGMEIVPGVATSGMIGEAIPEQALVVDAAEGLVILTGCAHPGIARMVRAVKELFQEEVYLVMGGFHLGRASTAIIEETIEELQILGVDHVAPSHCTGDAARQLFQEAFGEDYFPAGAGQVFIISL